MLNEESIKWFKRRVRMPHKLCSNCVRLGQIYVCKFKDVHPLAKACDRFFDDETKSLQSELVEAWRLTCGLDQTPKKSS